MFHEPFEKLILFVKYPGNTKIPVNVVYNIENKIKFCNLVFKEQKHFLGNIDLKLRGRPFEDFLQGEIVETTLVVSRFCFLRVGSPMSEVRVYTAISGKQKSFPLSLTTGRDSGNDFFVP